MVEPLGGTWWEVVTEGFFPKKGLYNSHEMYLIDKGISYYKRVSLNPLYVLDFLSRWVISSS